MPGIRICKVRSERPYFIEEADLSVYSIEELAYYLYHNIFFVDKKMFRESLITFMEHEWKRELLAQKLRYTLNQKCEMEALVLLVLEDSGYFSEDEIKLFKKNLRQLSGKSPKERRKLRAEKLLERGRIAAAYDEYQIILNEKAHSAWVTGNAEQDLFFAEVYAGMGDIRSKMFFFEEAAEDFKKSYILSKKEIYAKKLIYTQLLQNEEQAWGNETGIKQIANQLESLGITEELVRVCVEEVKACNLEGEMTKEYDELGEVLDYRTLSNMDQYHKNLNAIIESWKKEYRLHVKL